MLSYSLGSLKFNKNNIIETNVYKSQKKAGGFSYIKTQEMSIIKELEKYGKYKIDTVRRLTKILEDNNFNVRMLIAADNWYRGNGNPKLFTSDMFTPANLPFAEITEISRTKKVWSDDSIKTLIIYANYLKNNVYNETDNIKVVSRGDDEEEDFDYLDTGDGDDE